jgi:hypothetical protein
VDQRQRSEVEETQFHVPRRSHVSGFWPTEDSVSVRHEFDEALRRTPSN